jgi:hypothetical protein
MGDPLDCVPQHHVPVVLKIPRAACVDFSKRDPLDCVVPCLTHDGVAMGAVQLKTVQDPLDAISVPKVVAKLQSILRWLCSVQF